MATLTTGYQVVAETGTQSFNGVLGKLQILAKYTSQKIKENTTVTNYVARFVVSNGGYIYDGGGVSWNLRDNQGNTTSKSSQSVQWYNGNHDYATLSPTIKHNEDGSKSITISASISFGNWGKNFSTSATVVIPTIKRGSVITDVTSATSSTLTPLSVEDTLSVAITKYVSTYTDVLQIAIDESVVKQIDNVYDGYEITFTEDELSDVFIEMIDAPYGEKTFTFKVLSYDGEDLIQINTFEKQLKIYDADPIFSGFLYQDTNPTTIAITNDNNIFIEKYSTAKLYTTTTTNISAKKGAILTKLVYAIGNEQKEVDFSSTGTFAEFPNVSSNTFTCTAVDSRGNSTKVVVEIFSPYWVAYNQPVITLANVERQNNGVGTNTFLSFEGKIPVLSYSSFSSRFGATLKAYYRSYGSIGDYTEIGTIDYEYGAYEDNTRKYKFISFNGEIPGDLGVSGFTLGESYEIKLSLYDQLSGDYEEMVLDSGTPALAIHKDGIGIGAAYDEDLGGELQITGTAYYNGQELGTGGGGDTLPVGAIFDYDGDTVPSGYEEVDVAENVYAEEETIIGYWGANKIPVYRKVYYSETNSTTVNIAHGISGLNRIISVGGFLITSSSQYLPWGFFIGTDYWCSCYINSTNIVTRCSSGYANSGKLVILEYTKS